MKSCWGRDTRGRAWEEATWKEADRHHVQPCVKLTLRPRSCPTGCVFSSGRCTQVNLGSSHLQDRIAHVAASALQDWLPKPGLEPEPDFEVDTPLGDCAAWQLCCFSMKILTDSPVVGCIVPELELPMSASVGAVTHLSPLCMLSHRRVLCAARCELHFHMLDLAWIF